MLCTGSLPSARLKRPETCAAPRRCAVGRWSRPHSAALRTRPGGGRTRPIALPPLARPRAAAGQRRAPAPPACPRRETARIRERGATPRERYDASPSPRPMSTLRRRADARAGAAGGAPEYITLGCFKWTLNAQALAETAIAARGKDARALDVGDADEVRRRPHYPRKNAWDGRCAGAPHASCRRALTHAHSAARGCSDPCRWQSTPVAMCITAAGSRASTRASRHGRLARTAGSRA